MSESSSRPPWIAAGSVFSARTLAEAETWRHWARARALLLASCAIVVPLLLLAIAGTLYWPGRAFPGFFVMRDSVVPTVGVASWTGLAAGVPFHGRVVAIDGRALEQTSEIYEHAARVPLGTMVAYTIEKDGAAQVYQVPTMRFERADYWGSVGLFVMFATVAYLLSLSVGLVQPRSVAAQAFVLQGTITSLYGATGTMLYQPMLWWATPLHLIIQAAVPAVLIHLGLRFPDPSLVVTRGAFVRLVPWLVSAALVPPLLRGFDADPPDLTALYLIFYYTIAAIFVLITLVLAGYRRDPSAQHRRQRHIILPGLVFGIAASVVGFVDIAQHGGTFPLQWIAPFTGIFYLSVAWAIARYELFDIDRYLRSLLVYAALTLVVALTYAGVIVGAGWLGTRLQSPLGGFATVGFFVVVAILFEPMRWRVQRIVERAFFRGRADYRETVTAVSQALTALLDVDDIFTRVGRTVDEAFGASAIDALLWLDGAPQRWTYAGLRMQPAVVDAMCDGVRDQLLANEMRSLGGSLIVPVTLQDAVVGGFALGPRRSGQPYTTEDRALLATLAAQTAIAVANARSYEALLAANAELEARVRARTAELERALREREALQVQVVQQEKMASLGVLVAGVAHEINNPITFIVGTVPPLRAALADLLTRTAHDPAHAGVARAAEMVDVIADGAQRTARIVQDLRLFSRLGEAETRPIDLRETLEVVIRLARPRWVDRIVIEREWRDVPLVEASPEQMSQVFMNLLVNACDAIPERGTIRIGAQEEGEAVVIAIADSGIGIAAQDVPRVFDPFFSTKRTGQGTGLGLAISYGIVARHGGRLEVSSTLGRGTEFRVSLPRHRGPIGDGAGDRAS